MRRGSVKTTSFDVAALAGVSQSAVSRAFTPGASIAEETRKKVLDAARKLNYLPNFIASSLTTHRSNIVAVILGSLDNPFYLHVFKQFSRELQKQNRQILTFILSEDLTTDDAIMKVLQYQVDAVVLTSAQLSTRTISLCHDRGIPVVLFNRYVPNSGAFGVRCDNAAGGAPDRGSLRPGEGAQLSDDHRRPTRYHQPGSGAGLRRAAAGGGDQSQRHSRIRRWVVLRGRGQGHRAPDGGGQADPAGDLRDQRHHGDGGARCPEAPIRLTACRRT